MRCEHNTLACPTVAKPSCEDSVCACVYPCRWRRDRGAVAAYSTQPIADAAQFDRRRLDGVARVGDRAAWSGPGHRALPSALKTESRPRVQIWACTVLKRLGVELTIAGTPARVGPMLLVSNHISWLDIVVLHAVCHCRFVSKADVKRWPLIGTLATG